MYTMSRMVNVNKPMAHLLNLTSSAVAVYICLSQNLSIVRIREENSVIF